MQIATENIEQSRLQQRNAKNPRYLSRSPHTVQRRIAWLNIIKSRIAHRPLNCEKMKKKKRKKRLTLLADLCRSRRIIVVSCSDAFNWSIGALQWYNKKRSIESEEKDPSADELFSHRSLSDLIDSGCRGHMCSWIHWNSRLIRAASTLTSSSRDRVIIHAREVAREISFYVRLTCGKIARFSSLCRLSWTSPLQSVYCKTVGYRCKVSANFLIFSYNLFRMHLKCLLRVT